MSRGRPKSQQNLTTQDYMGFFVKYIRVDENGCHRWTGGKNNVGYGMFRYKKGMATAHRAIMDMEGYDIEGKYVYHTCDNYDCVNPDHLRIGNIQQKSNMMHSKGRSGTFWSDKKYYKTCVHCGYVGSPAVIGRSHNDKCKFRSTQKV